MSQPYTVSPPTQYFISDRPIDKEPLRRIQKEGAEALDLNELLQVALGQAEGFENILQEYGSRFLTTLHSVKEISDALKLDHLQATRLLAILSIGRQLWGPGNGALVRISHIEEVFQHCRQMSFLDTEQLKVMVLNNRHQLMHDQIIASGHSQILQVSPLDVFQPAVARRLPALILVHNHPSGNPEPSPEDLQFSQRIKAAAAILDINVLDHVIIGRDSYRSCF